MEKKFFYIEEITPDNLSACISEYRLRRSSGGCMVFLPEREAGKIPDIQAVFNRFNFPFFGAVFPEIIFNSSFCKSGVLLLMFDQMPEYFFSESLEDFSLKNTISLEKCVNLIEDKISGKQRKTLFFIFDGMLSGIASMLDFLYFRLFDRVGYMGANAGSETFQSIGCVFDNSFVGRNRALMVFLENHPGAHLEHGYQNPEKSVTATSTTGNKINSIEWRPAFDVYREVVQKSYGVDVTRDNFYSYGVHFPFAIIRPDKTMVIRIPVGLTDDGALFCVGEIPPSSLLTLLELPKSLNERAIEAICSGLSDELENDDAVMIFYCAGRRLHFGEKSHEEIKGLAEKLPGREISGALSLGELGNTAGIGFPMFQNSTILCSKI